MNDRKRILVTGANGNLGGAVVRALNRGTTMIIAGGTHPENMQMPQGVKIRNIDYIQPVTLAAATNDVEKVTGRPPISFGDFALKHATAWK